MKWAYIAAGLVVVAGGAWLAMGGLTNDVENEMPNNTEQSGETSDTQQFSGSMQDLLSRSGSWQCDVSVNAGGVVSNGTTYVSGGKMRADFTSNIPQVGSVETHMIMRDNTAYTWSSMMNRGFKFPIQNGQVSASGADAQAAAAFNQNYNYDCDVWARDESKFALPSNITF